MYSGGHSGDGEQCIIVEDCVGDGEQCTVEDTVVMVW